MINETLSDKIHAGEPYKGLYLNVEDVRDFINNFIKTMVILDMDIDDKNYLYNKLKELAGKELVKEVEK